MEQRAEARPGGSRACKARAIQDLLVKTLPLP